MNHESSVLPARAAFDSNKDGEDEDEYLESPLKRPSRPSQDAGWTDQDHYYDGEAGTALSHCSGRGRGHAGTALSYRGGHAWFRRGCRAGAVLFLCKMRGRPWRWRR